MTRLGIRAACGLLGLLAACGGLRGADREDVLIADFEGKDYGDWKTTGTAFGPGPAQGTLPNQMPVSGYKGKGLVNSFYGGDAAVGTLTSPPVKIERKYINFLIGGGCHPGETCINLLVGDKVVRTATGPNDRPGGSERLDWHTWDVDELAGKMVVIQIVDSHTGGWGHINIDHIVQSDRREQAEPAAREFAVAGRYLNLPVKNGAAKRRVRYEIDGATVREFEIELADDAPSFWVFSDVSAFRDKKLRVVVDALPASSKALDAVTAGDEIKGADAMYQEKGRPQFHFTSRRGWLNDPNGLVFFKGEYHLFYQHNPFGWEWGNMHWGHAVSKDLVHWKELPEALYPRQFGDWCFSGSAVVDAADASGFKTGAEPALVAAYTSTGRGECVAFSNDRGRTWTDFKDDPVVKHAGRDPRLLWHEPSKHWVMAVYDETDGKRGIAFYTSPDLKKWDYQSRVEGFFECPDLFELPVDGDDAKRQWVLYSGDARYVLGDFDGKTFKAKTEKLQLWHGNFYAAQTYSNAPDGRRIQIGWDSGVTFPGMPFNQQMSAPCNLTLRTTADGVRLFAQPVPEIESLHDKKHTWEARALAADATLEVGVPGELLDVRAEFEVGKAETISLTVRGVPVVYDAKKGELSCNQKAAPLKPLDGKIRLRLLVDRGSIEVFGNDGRVALSVGVKPAEAKSILVQSHGGEARLTSLEAVELKSAWAEP